MAFVCICLPVQALCEEVPKTVRVLPNSYSSVAVSTGPNAATVAALEAKLAKARDAHAQSRDAHATSKDEVAAAEAALQESEAQLAALRDDADLSGYDDDTDWETETDDADNVSRPEEINKNSKRQTTDEPTGNPLATPVDTPQFDASLFAKEPAGSESESMAKFYFAAPSTTTKSPKKAGSSRSSRAAKARHKQTSTRSCFSTNAGWTVNEDGSQPRSQAQPATESAFAGTGGFTFTSPVKGTGPSPPVKPTTESAFGSTGGFTFTSPMQRDSQQTTAGTFGAAGGFQFASPPHTLPASPPRVIHQATSPSS